jgi:hypothetical protein
MSLVPMLTVARVGIALLLGALAWGVLLGCEEGPDDVPDAGHEPARAAVFPADFADRYRETRDCRHSHEHELHYIRVLVSADAEAPYAALSPDEPYPVGATLVKAEYDDELCELLVGYTAYEKRAKGENPAGGDWWWQKLDADENVLEEGAPWRCINCHTVHCAPPYGYDLTCAEEL